MLTLLGQTWGRDTDELWAAWAARVTAQGGCVTLGLGPNYDDAKAPAGTFDEGQLRQLRAIAIRARGAERKAPPPH